VDGPEPALVSAAVPGAFFEPDGDRFVPSELTRGPWDPDSQHAGPPAALLGGAIEGHDGSEGAQVGRITCEILRPVPISPLRVSVRVARPGRSVELLEATLSDGEDEVMSARAWRLRGNSITLPAGLSSEELGAGGGEADAESGSRHIVGPPPRPDEGEHEDFFPTGQPVGYHTAMEYRFVAGRFLDPGPATVWMRMRHPLVDGEEPSPLQRVLVAADSGNGVSATLDWRRYLFVNVDLTVNLHRHPAGEWVCLEAITIPEPGGVGLADTALYDERGRIGRATQTLLIAERGG
jgi:hypothetical protein